MAISDIAPIHAFLGFVAMYISWLYLVKSEKLTAKELDKAYPQHKPILRRFLLPYLGWVVLAIVIFTSTSLSGAGDSYGFGNLFASIGLFLGLFALKTGICVVPNRNSFYIRFVVGETAYRAGRLQTIWSLAVLALPFLWTAVLNVLF